MSEPTRNGDGRQTIFIEWRHIPECESPEIRDIGWRGGIVVGSIECGNRGRWYRSRWRDYRIHGFKRPTNFLPKMHKFTVRDDVVASAYVSAGAYQCERGLLIPIRRVCDK